MATKVLNGDFVLYIYRCRNRLYEFYDKINTWNKERWQAYTIQRKQSRYHIKTKKTLGNKAAD